MKTKFDEISDNEIAEWVKQLHVENGTQVLWHEKDETDAEKIGGLVINMHYHGSWLGPPVVFFTENGSEHSQHHTVRACKYLARRVGLLIQIPVKYDSTITETEAKQTRHDKDYRAPCSQDCQCRNKPATSTSDGVGDTLCK